MGQPIPDEIRWNYRDGVLSLSGHGLETFPEEIFQIEEIREGITELQLYGNRLRVLPPQLGDLPRLRKLDLNDNQLRGLPPQISKLTNLQSLDVSNNPLQSLPVEIRPLLLRGLDLFYDGTPLAPTLDALGKNTSGGRRVEAVLAYLASLQDSVELFETKVIFVGEGNVGKTTLVEALRGGPFIENRKTTHGIEIKAVDVRNPNPSLETLTLKLRIWDFGGQEVYRITHQFFFSQRAVYVVVWSPREGQEQNEVEGWLRRIRIRVGPDAPTLVVATHGDERRAELDFPRLRREFPGMLKGSYVVDSQSRAGLEEFESGLAAVASELPQMGQVLSERWVAVRQNIEALSKSHAQISYANFRQACRRAGVESGVELSTVSSLMHDLGDIVYYGDDDGLRDLVVLNPEWLTKAIGYVLEDMQTRWDKGVLDHRRLRAIWGGNEGRSRYPEKLFPFFLRLMEKFDVSYRIADVDQKSLVAQLVPFERPGLPWNQESAARPGIRSLRLVFELDEIAPGLIAWLTVRLHHASTGRHWRTGVFLRHPIEAYDSDALIELETTEKALSVHVRAPSPDLFFNVIRDTAENLLRSRWPGLSYRMMVPCPAISATGRCTSSFPLSGLLEYRERGGRNYPCLVCQTDHDVTQLLTGFAAPDTEGLLKNLAQRVDSVQSGITRLEVQASEISRHSADASDLVRRLVKAAGQELSECPRLFTMRTMPTGPWLLLTGRRTYRLTLWCEHTAAYHPCPQATYVFTQPTAWLAYIGPYISVISKVLRVAIPIAGAVAGVLLSDEQWKDAQQEITLMKTLAEKLPAVPAGNSEYDRTADDESFSQVEGSALRAFAALLQELDSVREFGDLRRVLAPTGEFLWVCPDHYQEYDPGLPVLP